MLHSVKGIVLRTTKYTDNSVIVNVYTNLFGLQTYIARGVHSRTSKVKANYFRGLTYLNMVVTKTEKQKLERITEVTDAKNLINEFDQTKTAVALFLNELLYKTIHEEEANPVLFEFLQNAFELLGLKESGSANFHLVFMLKYSQYLGFFPSGNYSNENKYFDLMEGKFISHQPHHVYYLQEPLSKYVSELMNSGFEKCAEVQLTQAYRRQLIAALTDYYKLHHVLTVNLTSVQVLEQL
ncbi:MAG: DNA repair protein RecO [Bacteroidia bacterium]|nr:DNA repair protein RecO [Bacteroidia bacterium]